MVKGARMMKKLTAIIAAMTVCFVLVGCNMNAGADGKDNFGYKLGVAAYTHADDSKGYTRGSNGQDRVSTTYVAIVFDNDGKIVKASIDEVESRLDFDGTGRLVGRTGGAIKSKKELGDAYNMKLYSPIGKEWYEQIETLENWLVGKNIREIVSGGMDKDPGTGANMTNSNSYDASSNYSSQNTGDMTGKDDSVDLDGSMPSGEDIPQNPNGTLGGTVPDNTLPEGSGANSGNNVISDITDGIGDMLNDGMDGEGMYTGWMDSDLTAGVTIDTTYIYKAIQKACESRRVSAEDKQRLRGMRL